MSRAAASRLTTGTASLSAAWHLPMANPNRITTQSAATGLFISRCETDILRVVAHSWLIWHTFISRHELKEQRQTNRRPYLYHLRRALNAFVGLGSVFALANAAWHLMSLSSIRVRGGRR